MKCALIVCMLVLIGISEAKWCIKKLTSEIIVRKVLSRTKLVESFLGPDRVKSETYYGTVIVPQIKDKRVCCDGYILDKSSRTCNPSCPNGCPLLAECVEPNLCKCHPGYSLRDGKCRMDCENCENGRCTDLGVCECNPMYVRFEDACTPICRRKCVNGVCSAPDVCKCNAGYQEYSETEGCEPICKRSCGDNAHCSSPEVCTCNDGFFGNAYDTCQPWCKSECKNGECVGPNTCACHQGFEKADELCIPDCHSGCKFGKCLDEGVCECWPGFVYNNSTGSCQRGLETYATSAPCVNDCQNGVCKDGSCHCDKDFIKVDESCLIVCMFCKIGDCVEESVCQHVLKMTQKNHRADILASEPSTTEPSTLESSTITSTTELTKNCENECSAYSCINGICTCVGCIMPCEVTCKNGACNSDNVCECFAGYVHTNGDMECINSTCIAPNQCVCLEGYTGHFSPASGHSCLPTCNGLTDGCQNGTCVAVDKCQCLNGFVHNPVDLFECILFVEFVEELHGGHGALWYLYLLLGLFVLLVMSAIAFLVLRKTQQDSYNVDKVEKYRGTVQFNNCDQPYCVM